MGRIKKTKKIWPSKKILWGLFFFGLIIYSLLQLSLYYNLGTPMRDVGIFSQTIWHLSRFEIPASTLRGMANLWGDHFHPILILIAPFYWIKPDVRWLFLIQAAVVSAGVFPIFAIARDKLKSDFAGFSFAFSWLFFIGLQHAIRFGFYPETLALTFLAFAIYFLFQKRIWPYFIFVILALICKENISLYIAFLGLWTLIFTRQRWVGLITFILGLAWFEIIVGFLIPHLAQGPYYYFRYGELGNTPSQALKTIIFHPVYVLKIAFAHAKLSSWFYNFAPFGFLPLFSSFLLVLVPVMAEKFLSTDASFWVMGFHYGASAVTFLAVSGIMAAATFSRWLKPVYVGVILIILTLVFSFNKTGNPYYSFGKKSFWRFSFPANYQEAIKLVPQDKSLTAQMTLGTALVNRPEIYWWSDYPEQKKGDYILVSCNYATFPYSQTDHLERIKEVLASGDYGIRYSQGDILLLEKSLKDGQGLSGEMKACLEE